MNLFEAVIKHFWAVFVVMVFVQGRMWRSAVQPRIEKQPELEPGYQELYKNFLFWCNVPWVLMGAGILTGQAASMVDFLQPIQSGGYVYFWYGAVLGLFLYFAYWVVYRRGAEILAKHPGLPMIPQWSQKSFRYFAVGLFFWNAACILLIFIMDWWNSAGESEREFVNVSQNFWDFIFPILFAGGWVLTCVLLSAIGGWTALAKFYPAKKEFTGNLFRLKSGRMSSLMTYNGCLTIGANREGLFLAVMILFRMGHPPLFIPWSDITVHSTDRWFYQVDLEFAKTLNRLSISKGLAENLAAESQGGLRL